MRILIFLLLTTSLFGMSVKDVNRDIDRLFTVVNQYQDICVNDNYYRVDLKKLIKVTAQIESRYGRDEYKGKVAKTVFQYEMDTASHYVKNVGILKSHLESELGRKISIYNEKDCVYVTYLIYMAKFRFHKEWLDKYYDKYYENDIEWLVYKVFWNSSLGATTKEKYDFRIKELIEEGMLNDDSK